MDLADVTLGKRVLSGIRLQTGIEILTACLAGAWYLSVIRARRIVKKSTMVTLVLSSTLVSGCDERSAPANWSTQGDPPAVTNNTYVPGQGYYHAPYHGWFPYPYNFYRPGFGYYHGGIYTPGPVTSDVVASRPFAVARGPASALETFGRAISRGGFGFSGRAGS
jgi:hypothetical protein